MCFCKRDFFFIILLNLHSSFRCSGASISEFSKTTIFFCLPLSLNYCTLSSLLLSLFLLSRFHTGNSKAACKEVCFFTSTRRKTKMLHCCFVPGRGRFVEAASKIPAGNVIFREDAYCIAPRLGSAKRQRCVYCCGDAQNQHAKCHKCGSVFCCEECTKTHLNNHNESGECCAIAFTKIAASSVPDEDLDTFEMTCLVLARCEAEGKRSRLCRILGRLEESAFETVGFGMEVATPLDFLNVEVSPETVFVPSYDHVECLGTNMRDTNPEIVEDFSKLYDIYQKTLKHKKYVQQTRLLKHRLPSEVNRETFVAICTAFLCNGFGIWNAVNCQLGVALYPQSSYFNHSCAPNMGRRDIKKTRVIEFFAARDIEKGEALCISYIDLKLLAEERRVKLSATYSFYCSCMRCDPAADYIVANTVCNSCVPALCCNCISKVMQPLGNGIYVCPCCDEKQESS